MLGLNEQLLDIQLFYEMAEDVMDAVNAPGVTNRPAQLELATPVYIQAINSANVLYALVSELTAEGRKATSEECSTMEEAFRDFYSALSSFIDSAYEKLEVAAFVPPDIIAPANVTVWHLDAHFVRDSLTKKADPLPVISPATKAKLLCTPQVNN